MKHSGYTLGLDLSTQSFKALLMDPEAGKILGLESIRFGEDLLQYNSPDGFLPNDNPEIRCANPLMFLDALDCLFNKLRKNAWPLDCVTAISGAAQQHGSVYLKKDFEKVLSGLSKERTLSEQLKDCFSNPVSPLWMDRSTTRECRELMEQFGDRIQQVTGSPAIERFTGPQIRKFFHQSPQQYAQTCWILPLSTFMASILAGQVAPVDTGDGGGMNLLDLKNHRFDPEITAFTAPGLMGKLPRLASGKTIVGNLSAYFQQYGFTREVSVVLWSGDNPSSLIGMGAFRPGTAVVSCGTSDTFFAAMENFQTDPNGYGHVFGNPAGGFMSLVCFSNGSLARERFRKELNVSWDAFNELVQQSNGGKLLLPYFEIESTPKCQTCGIHWGFDRTQASPADLARSILESQMLSIKLHTRHLGTFNRLKITGGASANPVLCQMLSNVFQAPVETLEVKESAALGGALLAAWAVTGSPLEVLAEKFTAGKTFYAPDKTQKLYYEAMLQQYEQLEYSVLGTN